MIININPTQLNIRMNGSGVSASTGTPIVKEYVDRPLYDGETTVTPTESQQTLLTDGCRLEDNITVNAIPSDYVGSSVTRRSSSDLTASGDTVTAPSGYYESSASKSVQSGSVSVPATDIRLKPEIFFEQDKGQFSVSVSEETSITPSVIEGYVVYGESGAVRIDGYDSFDLKTSDGGDFKPTESPQTLAPKYTWVTGDVSVSAIPSDYVGSGIDRRDSSDLIQTGATINVPSGYYAENAAGTIQNATLSPVTVSVTPDITVDANGLVTASKTASTLKTPVSYAGYATATDAVQITSNVSNTYQLSTLGATTYTPSNVAQEIAAGQYLTGAQTISAIAPPYYDMSGSMSWLGAGAELVHEITPITVALKDTDFNTWTPSTTAATVVASQTLSGSTQKYVATDLLLDGGYNYINIWCMKLPVVYTGSPTNTARTLFSCGLLVQAIFRRYSSYTNLLDGNMNNNVTAQTTLATFERYYNSSSSLTYTNAASYGFYFANVAPTISSTTAQSPTITLKTPTMSARCSTTYLSTANCGLVDKTNTKLTITCKVYRVKQDCYLQGYYRYLAARVAEMNS